MRNNGIFFLLVAGSLFGMPQQAASQPTSNDPKVGDIIVANVTTMACRTEGAVDKTKWLARQGDPEAAVEFMVQNCIPIKMGHTGTLVTAIRYGYNGVCVRWRGEPDCLWSPRGQLLSTSADKN